ncbi:hypothetical protein AGMMS49982_14260 [Bacteroidia bacterium]|nr:hypothetical protein AGMMS49982_14260 [Bacteroidia bacterium]
MLLFAAKAVAQDIEAMINAPILTVNGGVSANQIATITPGDTTGTNPYSLFVAGNLNLNFFGVVDIPLSFAYTNQELSKDASLPFNRFSISPSYKWVKVYAGYTSMQFSPYSLAGHELFGGGFELTPDNGFKISALYGRLKEASLGGDGIEPTYKRMGGGFDVEYKGKQYDVGVNLFAAQDDPSSAPFDTDSIILIPQENLTGSVKANVDVMENLRLGAEYGFSALNQALFHAVKTNFTYSLWGSSIGATYERVAPNYTTLGAYYMTNDYENITGNFATAIKKLNIAVNAGYQQDNLDKQKSNSTSRMIYSLDLSSNVNEKLSLGLNLSNQQSYIFVNDVYSQVTQTNEFENLDTLNVTQLNYTAAINGSYTLQSTKEQRQSVSCNFMYQKSAEAQQYSDFAGNDIYNTSVSYQFSLVPLKLNTSVSVNHNYSQMPQDMYSQAMTYNLSLQKIFFEELQTGLTATYSDMGNQTGNLSNVVNLRLNAGYQLAKKHSFNLSLSMLHSEAASKTRLQYAANLSYSYAFNVTVSRKNKKLKLDANF